MSGGGPPASWGYAMALPIVLAVVVLICFAAWFFLHWLFGG